MRICRPYFLAANPPAPRHSPCMSPHRRQIGAGARFAEPDTEIALATNDARQKTLLLLLRAVLEDQRTALPIRDPVGAHGCARGEQLLEHDVTLGRGTSMATEPLRPYHPNEPCLSKCPGKICIVPHPAIGASYDISACEFPVEKRTNF